MYVTPSSAEANPGMQDVWRKLYGRPSRSPTENREDEEIDETLTKIRDRLSEVEQQQVISSDFAPKALKLASRLPFIRDMVAGYYCMVDGSTPTQIKAAILVPLVYFVLPADAVPDIIPAAGFTDDLTVWIAALKLFGSHLSNGHYRSADALLKSEERGEEEA